MDFGHVFFIGIIYEIPKLPRQEDSANVNLSNRPNKYFSPNRKEIL